MNFLWPHNLWLTLAVPLLPLLYVWLLHRRSRSALRYSSLATVRGAARRSWRRHLPPALVWIACSMLLVATARPSVRLTLPWARSTIMLAIDVSLSMRVADVEPNRMAAAQMAATAFLRELPPGIDVGIVTFAGSAQVAQQATLDRQALLDSIDRMQMQFGTAIGNAIVVCLEELFPDQGIDLADMNLGPRRGLVGLAGEQKPVAKQIAPVAPGSYPSAAIILLSDGRRTTGVDTLEAAKMAADRGVRIYVIGLGTVDGAVAAGEGMAIYMQLDEPTLREVARMTGGEYHHAGTAEDLRKVYQDLRSRVQVQTRATELTAVFALAAAIVLLAAIALSIAWFGRSA